MPGRPAGLLAVTLDGSGELTVNDGAASRCTDAGLPIVSFELGGARLSDAFLAMTEAA